MAAVRTSDRGILRAEQFRAFQVWLVEHGHSVQEEDEQTYWCSVEPKGADSSWVTLDDDNVCVTSYALRETVRRFQDSLVKRVDEMPVDVPSKLTEYEQDLRDDFAIAAMGGFLGPNLMSTDVNDIASDAYLLADAMLEARKK